jgi:hypothetical protein
VTGDDEPFGRLDGSSLVRGQQSTPRACSGADLGLPRTSDSGSSTANRDLEERQLVEHRVDDVGIEVARKMW